jgi:PAS domain S-box-containing protein
MDTEGPSRSVRAPRSAAATQVVDESLFRLLVDQVVDYAIFLLRADGHIASWNAGAERLKLYSADEAIGRSFEMFYTPEDRAAARPAHLLELARTHGRVEDEGWRVRKDGTRFWADVVITALTDEAGQLRGFAKVTRDLSARRAAEESLRQSEQRFQTLVASVTDYAIYLLSPTGMVESWNQGAQLLKGYAPDEIIGHSFERFYTPEDRLAGHPAQLLELARTHGRVEDEGWRVRKDGSRFWADVVITRLNADSGHLVGYAKVTRDLTARRLAEQDQAKRHAAERAAERLERLQAATVALAAAGTVESVAGVLAEVGSRSVEACAGEVALLGEDGDSVHVIAAGSDGSDQPANIELSRANDAHPLTYVLRTGLPLILDSRAQVHEKYPELAGFLANSRANAWAVMPLAVDRRVTGVLGVYFNQSRGLDADERSFLLALADVGAQAIDRARVYESERRARVEAEAAVHTQEEFLSIASHELRTPVAAIKATAQLADRVIQRGVIDASRTTRYLESIVRSSDRLAALIGDLLDVSRLRTGRLPLHTQTLDLRSVIQEVVDRYVGMAPERQFELHVPDHSVLVDADALRVEQVVDNLLSNAVKYSPDGGPIHVVVGTDGGDQLLTVTDHGIGLPAGQEARVFGIFGRASNATDRQIQGLGLGLAICRQLIELHGGRIWATSPGEGQGTTIGVRLPTGAAASLHQASRPGGD